MSRDIAEKRMRFYYHSCAKKEKHLTKEAAEDKIFEIYSAGNSTKLFTYFCTVCFGWHLTRQEKLEHRAKKRKKRGKK